MASRLHPPVNIFKIVKQTILLFPLFDRFTSGVQLAFNDRAVVEPLEPYTATGMKTSILDMIDEIYL